MPLTIRNKREPASRRGLVELDSFAGPVINHDQVLTRLEYISRLFDEAVRIPGTSIRLGWDAVIGLVPIAGDALTTVIAAYYIWEANRLGARKRTLVKMLANTGIDFLAGAIPLIGDIADVAWKSNRKNMQVLLRELQSNGTITNEVNAGRIARLLGQDLPRRSSAAHRAVLPYPLIMP